MKKGTKTDNEEIKLCELEKFAKVWTRKFAIVKTMKY